MKKELYIWDNQKRDYFPAGEKEMYESYKDILDQLADYHDIDYSGVKDNDEPYEDIYEFLATLQSDTHRLNWLLDYGEWEIHDSEGNEVHLS